MNKFMIGVAIGFLFGGVIGATLMANSKAATIANIVTDRNQQLQELEAKHSAELAAAYASVKDKVAEALANFSADEIGAAAGEETIKTIEEGGKVLRDWLGGSKPPKEEEVEPDVP